MRQRVKDDGHSTDMTVDDLISDAQQAYAASIPEIEFIADQLTKRFMSTLDSVLEDAGR